MNIVQQKIGIFRITDRFLDLILLFISLYVAIVFEHIYHPKSLHAIGTQAINYYTTLIIIFVIF